MFPYVVKSLFPSLERLVSLQVMNAKIFGLALTGTIHPLSKQKLGFGDEMVLLPQRITRPSGWVDNSADCIGLKNI